MYATAFLKVSLPIYGAQRRPAPPYSPNPSFGEFANCVAIATRDVVSLRHFFLESWIVWREPVLAVWSLDQEELLAVAAVQAVQDFFRKDDAEGIAEFADFDFDH